MPVNIQITGCSFTRKIIGILISIKYHKNTRIAFITHCTCPWICSFHEDVSKKFAHSIAYIALCFPPLIFFKKSSLELEKKVFLLEKGLNFVFFFVFVGVFFCKKKYIECWCQNSLCKERILVFNKVCFTYFSFLLCTIFYLTTGQWYWKSIAILFVQFHIVIKFPCNCRMLHCVVHFIELISRQKKKKKDPENTLDCKDSTGSQQWGVG